MKIIRVAQVVPMDGIADGGEAYTDEEMGIMNDAPLGEGDSVKLKEDVLQQHSRSVPPHAGYSKEQFSWRDMLGELAGQAGKITRIFPNSKHVNVTFDNTVIGIDIDQLERA